MEFIKYCLLGHYRKWRSKLSRTHVRKILRDFQGAALESLTRSVMIFGIVKLLRNFEFHNTAIQDELRNFENLSPIFNFRNDEM